MFVHAASEKSVDAICSPNATILQLATVMGKIWRWPFARGVQSKHPYLAEQASGKSKSRGEVSCALCVLAQENKCL